MSKENPECGDLFLAPIDRFLLVVSNLCEATNNEGSLIVIGIDPDDDSPLCYLGNSSYGYSINRCKEPDVEYLGNISGLAKNLAEALNNE